MTIEQKLQAIIDRFVGEITDLVREAALESVQSALAGGAAKAAPRRKTKKAAARKSPARKATRKTGKRVRRSAADLRATADAILAFIKANDGCAMSDISSAMRQAPIKLRPAIQILINEGSARTTGAKRGTKYHPGRGGAKKAASSKAKRKPAARKKKAARKTKRR